MIKKRQDGVITLCCESLLTMLTYGGHFIDDGAYNPKDGSTNYFLYDTNGRQVQYCPYCGKLITIAGD